jgi:hypothetical protein
LGFAIVTFNASPTQAGQYQHSTTCAAAKTPLGLLPDLFRTASGISIYSSAIFSKKNCDRRALKLKLKIKF